MTDMQKKLPSGYMGKILLVDLKKEKYEENIKKPYLEKDKDRCIIKDFILLSIRDNNH